MVDGRQTGYLVEFWKDENGQVVLGEETVFDDKGWWGALEPIRQVWRRWHEKAGLRTTDQSQ
jgi:hypothetical protein